MSRTPVSEQGVEANYYPLSGITVLDLSRLLPGPYCSLILADCGAEVIKIEDPASGDYLRWIPPLLREESAYFLLLNRNKKSVTLNLKSQEGRAIFLELVRQADVLLESFRPGVMNRLGLAYETLQAINPGLVYCSLTGYGQTGPYRERAGHDINYIALGGVLGLTGPQDSPPIIPGTQVADLSGGLWAALGILLALAARQRTGQGQYVDIAMLDGVVALLPIPAAEYFTWGESPHRGATLLTGGQACYHVYETKDGRYMALGALEPKFWAGFCTAVGREDLIIRQFDSDQEELIAEVQAIFRRHTRDEWVAFFADKDVCCEPVNDLEEVFAHPQVAARGMLTQVEHPVEGTVKLLHLPVRLSDMPRVIRSPAPRRGEHTEEILQRLGYDAAAIERLREQGVI